MLRRQSVGVIVAIVVCAFVVGYFVPLLGISLVAFLIIDVAIGAWKARRTEPAAV